MYIYGLLSIKSLFDTKHDIFTSESAITIYSHACHIHFAPKIMLKIPCQFHIFKHKVMCFKQFIHFSYFFLFHSVLTSIHPNLVKTNHSQHINYVQILCDMHMHCFKVFLFTHMNLITCLLSNERRHFL